MSRQLASATLRFPIALVLLVALGAPAFAGTDLASRYAVPFSTLPMYNTNFGVLVHDWNGDGVLDVTVACNSDDRVSTLKGVGHGAFGARVDFVGPDGPYKVAAGDIDGNGTPDMVIADYDANSVRVYYMLAGSDVNYSFFVDLPVGSGPINVAVADIDQDGNQDIVTANFYANNISVLRNTGGGSFQAHADYATGTEPWGLAVGNLNGDAYPDIVTANYGTSNLTRWLGSASGALTSGTTTSAGTNPTGIVLLDYDADGDQDAVVCNFGSSSITLLDGNGSGSLTLHGTIPSISAYAITTADLNNDGRLDLAIAGSEEAPGLVTAHLGTGSGALFGPHLDTSTGGELAEGISAGDLDGDGKLDLAVTSFPRNVSILKGNGDGSFGVNRRSAASPGQTYKKVAVAEITGDGHPDLILAGNPYVRVAQGNGAGNFTLVGQSGTAAVDIAVADLDQDGDLDVAGVNSPGFNNLSISLNPGNGTISTGSIYGIAGNPVAVAARDMNHDVYPDLVVACSSGELLMYLNQGDGSFGTPAILNVGISNSRRAVAIADLNGDTEPDLVVANYTNDFMEIYTNDGSGGFSLVSYQTGDKPFSIASGDFNADGMPDLAVACEANVVDVFINSGGGSFPPATSYSSPGVPGGVVVGDADQDAFPDLFVLDRMDYSVSVLNGSPTGAFFAQARAWGIPSLGEGLAVGDVNGDGRADIVECGNPLGAGVAQVLLYDTSPLPDRAPLVVAPGNINMEAGGILSLTVTARDSDLDAIGLLTAGGLPPTATFSPNGSNTSGTVNYTAASTHEGDYNATFTASNVLAGSRTTSIHVLPPTDMAGTFTWTPEPGDPGSYEVCFIATNLNGDPPDTSCTTVTVLPPAGAPPIARVAAHGAAASPTASGPTVCVAPTATVTVGQTLVLAPTAIDADALTMDASALPAGNDASFVADASPVVTAPANVVATPGVPVTIYVGAVDPDLSALTTLTASYPGLPPGNNATFVPSAGNGVGTFTWTPAAYDSGTYSVSFMAGNLLVGTAGTLIHVNTGLAGYWMLNGNGDDVANGANMKNMYGQGETYVPGKLGGALVTGTPPIALTGTATALHDFPAGQPRTLECWAKVSSASSGAIHEFVSAVSFSGQWWRLYLLNQVVTFEIMQNGSSSTVSTPLPQGGAWHHLALASTGSTMTLYLDGAPQGSAAVNSSAFVAGGAIYIGVENGASQILVDEVRLWHRNRTQSQILAVMNQELRGHVTAVESSPPAYRNGLAQNRPNPFNPRTEISFELARGGPATLRVYDASGRLVRTLLDRSLLPGPHQIVWDGIDALGRRASSGVYFYRLMTPGFESAKRMLLLK